MVRAELDDVTRFRNCAALAASQAWPWEDRFVQLLKRYLSCDFCHSQVPVVNGQHIILGQKFPCTAQQEQVE